VTTHLALVGDSVPAALPGDTLPRRVTVTVVDEQGEPQSGVAIHWATDAPYAVATPDSSLTDRFGKARTTWRLGIGSGTQHLRASVALYQESLDIPVRPLPVLHAEHLMHGKPDNQMCALDQDQRSWCWGGNESGELGSMGVGDSSLAPVPVAGDHRFTSLIGGADTSCGIDPMGQLWCWGLNFNGVFGNGTVAPRAMPVAGATGLQLAAVDMSDYGQFACGLTVTGRIFCWGHGILGDGSSSGSATPVPVGTDSDWTSVATGEGYSCGLRSDHSLWCWGSYLTTAGYPSDTALTPTQSGNAPPLATISANNWNPCGVRADQPGTAICFGDPFVYAPSSTAGLPLVTFGPAPSREVWATSAPFLALTSEGHIEMIGDSPYWGDGFLYHQRELTTSGPWSDVSSNSRRIYAIYQPDGAVYEIQLRLNKRDELVVLPIGLAAP
jgi:hypothetical protein